MSRRIKAHIAVYRAAKLEKVKTHTGDARTKRGKGNVKRQEK